MVFDLIVVASTSMTEDVTKSEVFMYFTEWMVLHKNKIGGKRQKVKGCQWLRVMIRQI